MSTRHPSSIRRPLPDRFEAQAKAAEANGRLGKFRCEVCGSRYPDQAEADHCCVILADPPAGAAPSETPHYRLRLEELNGPRTPLPSDPWQAKVLPEIRLNENETFPEMMLRLLAEGNGESMEVFRKHFAPLGISRPRWGGWIQSLKLRGYLHTVTVREP